MLKEAWVNCIISLESECVAAGFARETRAFHATFTVARLRQTQGARALAAAHKEIGFAPIEILVSSCWLFAVS